MINPIERRCFASRHSAAEWALADIVAADGSARPNAVRLLMDEI